MFPLLALALTFGFAFGFALGLLAAPLDLALGRGFAFGSGTVTVSAVPFFKGGGVGRRKEWAAGVQHLFLKSLQHPFFKGFGVDVVVTDSAIANSLSQAHECQLAVSGRHVHYALDVVFMENLF